ncbi:hypothetical protein HDU86_002730 [Geranomyces michiganensis]|nr:hypothetical protein HDU86_002730 [Geranomyces michiganensis]
MKRFLRRLTSSAPAPSTFGSHLDVQILRDRAAGRTAGDPNVPYIMKRFVKCLSVEEALQSEGLFRVGGSQKAIKDLRDKIDKTGTVEMHDLAVYDVPAVASVFKQWLRELPSRLVPDSFYPQVEQAAVAAHEAENRMSNANLSAMFAPNVFLMPSEAKLTASSSGALPAPSAATDQAAFMNDAKVVAAIMSFLLTHVGQIFGTEDPPHFVDPDPAVVQKTEDDSQRMAPDAEIIRTVEAPDLETPEKGPETVATETPLPEAERSVAPSSSEQPRGLGKRSALGGSFFSRKRGSTLSEQTVPDVQSAGSGSSPLQNRPLTKLTTQRPRSSSNPPAATLDMISSPIAAGLQDTITKHAYAQPSKGVIAATMQPTKPDAKRRTSVIHELKARLTSSKPRQYQSQPLSPQARDPEESEDSQASDLGDAAEEMRGDQHSSSSSVNEEDDKESASGSESPDDGLPAAYGQKSPLSNSEGSSHMLAAESREAPKRPSLTMLIPKPHSLAAAVSDNSSHDEDLDTDDEILDGTAAADKETFQRKSTAQLLMDAPARHRRSPSVSSSSSYGDASETDTESDSEVAERSPLSYRPAASGDVSKERALPTSQPSIPQVPSRSLDFLTEQALVDGSSSSSLPRITALQHDDRRKSVSFHLPQSSDDNDDRSESASASTTSSSPVQTPQSSLMQRSLSHQSQYQPPALALPMSQARSLSLSRDIRLDVVGGSKSLDQQELNVHRPLMRHRPASAPHRSAEAELIAKPVPNRPAPLPPGQAQKLVHSRHHSSAPADRLKSVVKSNPRPASAPRPKIAGPNRLLLVRQQAAAETASDSTCSYDTGTTTSDVTDTETEATESDSAFSDARIPAACRPAADRSRANTLQKGSTQQHELAASAARVALLKRRNSEGFLVENPAVYLEQRSSAEEGPRHPVSLGTSGVQSQSTHPLTTLNGSDQKHHKHTDKLQALEASGRFIKPSLEPAHPTRNDRRDMMALYAQIKEMKSKVAHVATADNIYMKNINILDTDDAARKNRAHDLAVLRALVASYREIKESLKSPTSPTAASPLSPTSTSPLATHLTTQAAARLACARHAANRPYELTAMSVMELDSERRDLKSELIGLKHAFAQRSSASKTGKCDEENDCEASERPGAARDEKEVLRALYARFVSVGKMIEAKDLAGNHDKQDVSAAGTLAMKREKKRIQGLLRSFQEDFERRNGRSVRTAEDREPVAKEYARYKQLRAALAEYY